MLSRSSLQVKHTSSKSHVLEIPRSQVIKPKGHLESLSLYRGCINIPWHQNQPINNSSSKSLYCCAVGQPSFFRYPCTIYEPPRPPLTLPSSSFYSNHVHRPFTFTFTIQSAMVIDNCDAALRPNVGGTPRRRDLRGRVAGTLIVTVTVFFRGPGHRCAGAVLRPRPRACIVLIHCSLFTLYLFPFLRLSWAFLSSAIF
ncbi:hypothetical protein F5051DRAFT_393194 [Lentinula edodes]|nr:hypothetical protein F5051DRAFT_393194 [Lentinula edodes]